MPTTTFHDLIESVRDYATFDLLLSVNREKLGGLLAELAVYKNKKADE